MTETPFETILYAAGGPIATITLNRPEQLIDRAGDEGVRAAVAERDGPFGDYSQAPPERRPNPDNVIAP